jgi:uncharacterized protein involved in tolerance to divalent cations
MKKLLNFARTFLRLTTILVLELHLQSLDRAARVARKSAMNGFAAALTIHERIQAMNAWDAARIIEEKAEVMRARIIVLMGAKP